MDSVKLLKIHDSCIADVPATCIAHCPIHVDVKNMADEIMKKNFRKAYKILVKKMPLTKVICRICDHVCEDVCVRKELGGSISIRQLEKSAVDFGLSKSRTFPIPKNGNIVAVIGAGISGLTAAIDLDKKGYGVTIYEKENKLGGRMWSYPKGTLPDSIIEEELEVINNGVIQVKLNSELTLDQIFSLSEEYDAIYVGIGKNIDIKIDMNTFQSEKQGIFIGGISANKNDSVIYSVSSGRRAAVSIDRYIQKKSLTAVRENEGSFITPIKVNLEGVENTPRILPMEGMNYTEEEAILEGTRCLKCQCNECLKACTHMKKFNMTPKKYIREINHNELIILGDHMANKLINSCDTCGLCGAVCPKNINMSEIISETRRSMVVKDKMPPRAFDFGLKDMEFSTSKKFTMVKHQPGFDHSKYMFFPGCQLSSTSPDYVKKVYEYLISTTNLGVGVMLDCCGAPAQWAGKEDLFQSNADKLKQHWNTVGKPILVMACSSCFNMFEKYIPEITFVSLWDYMVEHGIPEKKEVWQKKTFAIHDACSTRYNKKLQDSVRKIINSLGYNIEELGNSKEKTECCGYGGLSYYSNREQAEEHIKERTEESTRDYVAYCSMCRDLFAKQGKRTLHILDLLYGSDLDQLAEKKAPRLWERRYNRCTTKASLLKLWNEDYSSYKSETCDTKIPKIKIMLSEEIKNLMEKRWILLQDVEKVIDNAETNDEKFINPQNAHNLARKRLGSTTYWVEYEQKNKEYFVLNVYSHRMEVVEE